jgi:hypothetical protein
MSEVANKPGILLTKVPDHIVGRPHVNTVRRWAGRGVRGVRLRTWLVGGRRYTSAQAIAQFIRDLTVMTASTSS